MELCALPGPARLLAGVAAPGLAPLLHRTPLAVRVMCMHACRGVTPFPKGSPTTEKPFSSLRKPLRQWQQHPEGRMGMRRCPAPTRIPPGWAGAVAPARGAACPWLAASRAARAPSPRQSSRPPCWEPSDALGARHRSADGCVPAARPLQMDGGGRVLVQPGSLLAVPSSS